MNTNTTASAGSISRRAGLAPVIVSAVLGAAVFSPTLGNGFVLDDDDIVLKNPVVAEPGSVLRFWTARYWPIGLGSDPLYRPVMIASLRLNYFLHGEHAAGYHLVNLLLHGAVSGLVAAMALGLWSRPSAGWVAGLLYAVHPIHVEAVAPIVGRSELLAALFGLSALYVRMTDSRTGRWAAWRHPISISVLYFLALGSKEHAVFLYPVFVVVDLWRRRTVQGIADLPRKTWLNRVIWPAHLALLTALIAFLLLRWNVYEYRVAMAGHEVSYYANPIVSSSPTARLLTPFALTALAGRVLVWPAGLTVFYDVGNLSLATTVFEPAVGMGITLVAGILLLLGWAWRRGSPLMIVLCGLSLCLLVPCQFLPLARWFFAERWLYLPSAFAILSLAGLVRFSARSIVPAAVTASMVLVPITVSYARIWQNDVTMYTSSLARRPGSFHGQIGALLLFTNAGKYAEAAPLAEDLTERFPDSYIATARTFHYYLEVGDLENAERALGRLYDIEPLFRISTETAEKLEKLRAIESNQPVDTRSENESNPK